MSPRARERPAVARLLILCGVLLLTSTACFEPEISRRPRDREPLQPPQWTWAPEGDERWEFPLPSAATHLSDAQDDLEDRLAATAPAGRSWVVAVYQVDLPISDVVAFYEERFDAPPRTASGRWRFREQDLLPTVTILSGPPVQVQLAKMVDREAPRPSSTLPPPNSSPAPKAASASPAPAPPD